MDKLWRAINAWPDPKEAIAVFGHVAKTSPIAIL